MSAPTATGPDGIRRVAGCRKTLAMICCGAAITLAFAQMPESVDLGSKLFQDPQKGNCAACHRLASENAKRAPTIGPALEGLREKYPNHAALVRVIAEADSLRPDTIMPPYRRHRILSESEIEAIARYIETL